MKSPYARLDRVEFYSTHPLNVPLHLFCIPLPPATSCCVFAQTTNAARAGRFERAHELIELMKRNWKSECAAADAAQRVPNKDLKPSMYPYSIFISHATKRLSNSIDAQDRDIIEKLSESDAMALQRLCDQVRVVVAGQLFLLPATCTHDLYNL